ncbi:methionine gamma-lyase family protein, partial [Treponema sp. R6D11]
LDEHEILKKAKDLNPKAIFIQKSKGYKNRKSLSTSQVNEIIKKIRNICDAIVIVDNCYCELVEREEPKADLLAGSLIKNLGGTIAKTGGYIAGKSELVELSSNHLTSVGLGCEAGGNLGIGESILQGLYFAPIVVGEAIKTAIFASFLFGLPQEERYDIVQAIELGEPEKLEKFCQAIQGLSPIGSNQTPVPWDMPGYDEKVIMACGAFVEGCSLEISADGKFVPPYTAYLQGGTSFDYAKYAVSKAYKCTK